MPCVGRRWECCSRRPAETHLGIEGATETLLDQVLPFRQAERRCQEAFPIRYENIFVVVDALTPVRAGEAASALETRQRRSGVA